MDHKSVIFLRLLTGMVFGAIAGAIAAMLVAPQSGADTRRQLKTRGDLLMKKANNSLADTQKRINGWFNGDGKLSQTADGNLEIIV